MTCPECGGELELDRCCVIEERVSSYAIRGRPEEGWHTRQRLAAAVLCTRCEYCAELRDHNEPNVSSGA